MITPINALPPVKETPADTVRGLDVARGTSKDHLDAFVKDVKESLEDAETSVRTAIAKLHDNRHPRPVPAVPMPDPALPLAVVSSTPATERPSVLSPAPDPVLSEAFPLPVFSQARVPAVSVGLVNIKTEIENLIAANGGAHAVLENILVAIKDGLENPNKEAVVVLTEVAKLMGQLILDEAGYKVTPRP